MGRPFSPDGARCRVIRRGGAGSTPSATLLQGAAERPVAGPPGTLGAVETIAFEESAAVDVEAP